MTLMGPRNPCRMTKRLTLTSLLVGFGIGVGLANFVLRRNLEDETRQWISASAEDGFGNCAGGGGGTGF